MDEPGSVSPFDDEDRSFDRELHGLFVGEVQPGHGTLPDRSWAVVAHLSGMVPLGVALPLVITLWKGERSAYIGHHAVEALNFQTLMLLALLVCTLTAATVGLLLLPVVLLGGAGLSVRAARGARRGAWHRYPISLRLVS